MHYTVMCNARLLFFARSSFWKGKGRVWRLARLGFMMSGFGVIDLLIDRF